jgi:RNA polymerase sigma-70 factor (ECF subfamily)
VTPDDELQAAAWMTRAQHGDTEPYDALLRLLARHARAFVGRRVGFTDWVEDVVQDVLLTVHRTRATYDSRRPFGPWFYAIVNARLVDTLRARRRQLAREVADEDIVAAQPAGDTSRHEGELQHALADAVARLPRVQREVLSLLKYEEMSVRDVAARLGMSESAVKTTAHRGYKVLRRRVGGIGEHRSAH